MTLVKIAAGEHNNIVACNVYVSEGRSKDIISKLLQCALGGGGGGGTGGGPSSCCRLVHVFWDPRYNRSSFHFVGTTLGIISAMAPFCWAAWTTLEGNARDRASSCSSFPPTRLRQPARRRTDHPTVGHVDHVAVLPLSDIAGRDNVTGRTAIQIGQYLEAQHNHPRVLYYGAACPNRTPLATVRRTQTDFFHQQQQQEQQEQPPVAAAAVTVGAPDIYVENYNVRLQCDRATARTLTQRLRTLLSIEALTLLYGGGGGAHDDDDDDDQQQQQEDVYEVACNLTDAATTVDDIEREVAAWLAEEQTPHVGDTTTTTTTTTAAVVRVLRQYRVGTTAAQCRRIWAADERDYAHHLAALRASVLESSTSMAHEWMQ